MDAMPALPHPLTLEDRMLAGHRRRARREVAAQSLFLGVAGALLAAFALAAWLNSDPRWLAPTLTWIDGHAAPLALAALGASAWAMRQRMAADARRHVASSAAALPIWREVQRQRDTRLRWRFALQWTAALALLVALAALHAGDALWPALDGLRWSWLAALLAIVFVPAPRLRPHDAHLLPPRLARVPRGFAIFGSREFPNLPQWWWQGAGATWMRGRAAGALAFGLLIAPSEVAAIVVPLIALLLMALVNALDGAHRLAGAISQLLAERPPRVRQLWRSLMPLHGALALLLVALVLALCHRLGSGTAMLALIAVTTVLLVQIDLLMALTLRHRPARLAPVRRQCVLFAAALTSAFPPLLLLAAVVLWALLMQRLWRDAGDA